ncbi:hypothetical protein ACFY00_05690 [Kitasatospora sp. NPDC001540]|uniref:hypothetical protein n=1 Tax=Kitasatospora sp. NPDC001540 TaxID=3364014 RepID=UPI003687DBF9
MSAPNISGEARGALSRPAVRLLLAAVVVAACLTARLPKWHAESVDYQVFLQTWYHYIADHGGLRALSDPGFADYNVPYLYLLAGLTHLPVSALTGIKALSVAFDLLQAFFVFKLVALRFPGRSAWQPFAAALLAVLLPTVAANSGWWAQADSIYASFVVGGVYFVLRHRPWWACTLFGLAFAFKLQTVFVFPFLLVMVVTRQVKWQSLLAIPAVYLALDVPALLVGADPVQLLTVYSRQTGTYQSLALNAPSLYHFVKTPGSTETADLIRTVGVAFAAVVVIALTALAVFSRTGRRTVRRASTGASLTPNQVLLTALASAVTVPMLLPSMHDRYFYITDVLSLVVAFHMPRRLWYVPILVQASSLASYLPFLYYELPDHYRKYHWSANEWRLISGLMVLAALAVLAAAVQEYRRGPAEPAPAAPAHDPDRAPVGPALSR